ncbi:hypothetical protein [Glycomyces algeriensis]|uniref:Uncharacterized protein n=1 Tax=Glycomyces algeriensis TaxID=256037 RepID=A0A9W6G6C4_9ACTN|nr:hypothetical protein [Glycomyces algeriensis]MDA1367150.1 hypothetical protein [Glycomyces algeriensis]MDR7348463.1 hypothetical protein [Glycomyces algeriensis]GLI41167.1 hypothetical protein GALLR39Z86_10170 [Glycomyces algeriensis]
MSGKAFRGMNGGLEYELHCDRCQTVFRCNDDSYLSWDVLCSAADAEGWRVESSFRGRHECAECVPLGAVRELERMSA